MSAEVGSGASRRDTSIMNVRSLSVALTALALGAIAVAAGDESAHEGALKQMFQALDKLTKTLATMQDGDTAQAARPELRKGLEAWTAAKFKAAELPPPSKAEKDRLAKAYQGKMDEALRKFYTEYGRVRSFPAGRRALDELRGNFEPP